MIEHRAGARSERTAIGEIVARLHAKLGAAAVMDDDALADAIAECATGGIDLDLRLFLDAIPGLDRRPVPLDAAIEVVFAAMRARGVSAEEARETLVSNYPALTRAINTAYTMGATMISGTTLASAIAGVRTLALPASLGPRTGGGRPRYHLQQLIGIGSHGSVYLAQDRAFADAAQPAWVAVKRLAAGELAAGTLDEAMRARRVLHAHVTRVLDRFTDPDGAQYVVLEHVPGGSLEAWRRSQPSPVPARLAAELLAQVARGVQAAHSAGVIHRDLKPANILMTERGVPKITDFGLVSAQLASGNGFLGNLAFAAPEQYRGGQPESVTAAADIYALGGVLYWLLCGRFPNGDTHEAVEARLSDRGARPPSLRGHRPDLDPDLDAVCRRALATEPAERYGSADALANDLEAWLRGEVLEWTRPTPIRRVRLTARRSPRSTAVAAAALFAGLAAITWGAYAVGSSRATAANLALEEANRTIARHQEDARRTDLAVKSMTDYFQRSSANSVGDNWIAALTFVELSNGPDLTAVGEDNRLRWENRIVATRMDLDKARSNGRENDIANLYKENALCLWLITSGQPREAADRMAGLIPRARRALTDQGDGWFTELDMINECALALLVPDDDPRAEEVRAAHVGRAEADAAQLPVRAGYVRSVLQVVKDQLAKRGAP